MLFFAIYTATYFPYTYITMEADNFWVLTWDFWHLKLDTLPAFTSWLADFLMQFYSNVWVGVCIQTLVLGVVGMLAHIVLKLSPFGGTLGGRVAWLGLLPPVLLGYYCTFNLSFLLQCVFLFVLVLLFQLLRNINYRIVFSLVCVLVGFFLLTTPMLLTLLIIQAALVFKSYGAKKCMYWILPMFLLWVTPIMYSQQIVFIPFEQRYTNWGTYFDPLTSPYNRDGEYIKKCVSLANEGRWEDLLYREHIKSDAQRGNGTALRYALLAECAIGSLPENLLDYPINDENLFFYPHSSSLIASQFNRLFYLNIGVYDEAFHHAQEYSLLMPNGNSFSSIRQLIDYSIEEGEWDIADKFLTVLSKSSCHDSFIKERRTIMESAKKNFKKQIPLRADNFVGGYSFPVEMLRLARYYQDESQRKKMLDYAICSYIMRGDYNSFMIAINAFDIYKDKELPKAYKIFKDRIK